MTPLLTAIARDVAAEGGRLLVVGGTVRDRIMGRTDSKDCDCEVFGIQPDTLRTVLGRFGDVDCVGAAFGVYKLSSVKGFYEDGIDYDFSIPRRDSKSGEGHKGFNVVGDPFMSLEDAARRRDFTINAISFDPLTEAVLDPFNGIADIKTHTLRVVDPFSFDDDSLRVLRAIQFAARFDFGIDPASAALMSKMHLSDLPAERVWGEFAKLLSAKKPSIGFKWARALGVDWKLWPELFALQGVPQDPEWHPEGDVWTHTLLVVDAARQLLDGPYGPGLIEVSQDVFKTDPQAKAKDTTVMLAALCHDFGKPATTEVIDGRIRSLGHEEAGVEPTLRFLERLNVQTMDGYDVRAQVLALVEHHLRPFTFFKDPPRNSAFRRLSHKVDLLLLARVAAADTSGRAPRPANWEAIDWFVGKVNSLDLREGPPAGLLMGRHLIALGLKPGPRFGVILKAVYDAQMEGTVTTVEEAIDAAATFVQQGHC